MVRPLFIYIREDVKTQSIREDVKTQKVEVNKYGKRKRNNTEHRHNSNRK